MSPAVHGADFHMPARFVYRYRWRLLGWLLERHDSLREAFVRSLPGAVHRELMVTERIVEVPYVLRSLRLPPGSRVLDVGSRWSTLSLGLAALGYRVVALDLVSSPIVGAGPDVVQADIRKPPFRRGALDAAVMISTLEHVGLQAYDARSGENDDFLVMEELRSILRPGGLLLATVPFGRGGAGTFQRSYDGKRLRDLHGGWRAEDLRFFVRHGLLWREATEEEASKVDSARVTQAVALMTLRRP